MDNIEKEYASEFHEFLDCIQINSTFYKSVDIQSADTKYFTLVFTSKGENFLPEIIEMSFSKERLRHYRNNKVNDKRFITLAQALCCLYGFQQPPENSRLNHAMEILKKMKLKEWETLDIVHVTNTPRKLCVYFEFSIAVHLPINNIRLINSKEDETLLSLINRNNSLKTLARTVVERTQNIENIDEIKLSPSLKESLFSL